MYTFLFSGLRISGFKGLLRMLFRECVLFIAFCCPFPAQLCYACFSHVNSWYSITKFRMGVKDDFLSKELKAVFIAVNVFHTIFGLMLVVVLSWLIHALIHTEPSKTAHGAISFQNCAWCHQRWPFDQSFDDGQDICNWTQFYIGFLTRSSTSRMDSSWLRRKAQAWL